MWDGRGIWAHIQWKISLWWSLYTLHGWVNLSLFAWKMKPYFRERRGLYFIPNMYHIITHTEKWLSVLKPSLWWDISFQWESNVIIPQNSSVLFLYQTFRWIKHLFASMNGNKIFVASECSLYRSWTWTGV